MAESRQDPFDAMLFFGHRRRPAGMLLELRIVAASSADVTT
jgi:hypothetical protein